MQLLDAVNRVITSTGESEIDAVDGSHPMQAIALSTIDKVSFRKQARGWWFNSFTITLSPETSGPNAGTILVPSTYTQVRPVQRGLDYILRDGKLFDAEHGTNVGVATQVEVRERITDFTKLPETFADWVATAAALSFATTYDADPPRLATLREELGTAAIALGIEHTRAARLNMLTSGSAGMALARIRGHRYWTAQ